MTGVAVLLALLVAGLCWVRREGRRADVRRMETWRIQ